MFSLRLEEGLELEGREGSPVETVDRVQVDWHRNQLAVNLRKDSVLIRTPAGEERQILEHLARVRVEDVRPVLVDEHASIVVAVIGVAPDMIAPVDDQNFLVCLAGKSLGQHATSKACS